MNGKIVFYITTEFHYLAAHGILRSVFKEFKDSDVYFLMRLEPGKKNRLDDLKIPERFQVLKVCFSHVDGKVYPDVTAACNFLLNENKINHFISFLFHDPLFVYLSDELQKRGTSVGLAPDGMGAYVKFKSSTLRSRWMHSKVSYRFFKTHNLNFRNWWFASWDFGRNGYYSTIYALTPTIPFLKNKKVVQFSIQFEDSLLMELRESFKVDFSRLPIEKPVVLVISENKANLEYENKLIEVIKNQLPHHSILFKSHPNQPADFHSGLSIKELYFIDEVFPIELLMVSLNKGVVVSAYSNSMLCNNPKLKYIWTYPLLENFRYNLKPIKRTNPTEHVQTVSTFDELSLSLKLV